MVLINVYFIVFLFYMYCKSFIIYFLFIIQLIIQFKNVSTDLVLIILTTQIEYVSALSIVFFLNTCKFNSFFFFPGWIFFLQCILGLPSLQRLHYPFSTDTVPVRVAVLRPFLNRSARFRCRKERSGPERSVQLRPQNATQTEDMWWFWPQGVLEGKQLMRF